MTATAAPPTPRLGGLLVADSLAAPGAEVAFGVPGIHALAIWEGLRTGPGVQLGAFGHTTAVELGSTDLVACARSFGVPARAATPESLDEQLCWAFRLQGPAVVVLRARLTAARPTP